MHAFKLFTFDICCGLNFVPNTTFVILYSYGSYFYGIAICRFSRLSLVISCSIFEGHSTFQHATYEYRYDVSEFQILHSSGCCIIVSEMTIHTPSIALYTLHDAFKRFVLLVDFISSYHHYKFTFHWQLRQTTTTVYVKWLLTRLAKRQTTIDRHAESTILCVYHSFSPYQRH
jgi:hypothetical protein